MTAVRELIFAKIEELLNSIDGVQLVERMPTGDPDVFPALAIYDHGQAVIEEECGSNQYGIACSIEGYVDGASGSSVHAALSDLYANVIIVVMADYTLGGLAQLIEEGSLSVAIATLASANRLGFKLDLTIQAATQRDNPAQLA